MTISTFKDMYLAELQEARSVAAQLVEALPKMAEMADEAGLRNVMAGIRAGRGEQLRQLEEILARHGAEPQQHRDQSMERLLGESAKWTGMLETPALRDAGIVASAQRIVHYEIAAFGTLAAWADQLGLGEDGRALAGILEETEAADGKLTAIARNEVNPRAAA